MPELKRYRRLPGLNPKSLAESIENAVKATDNLTARGWVPDSDTHGEWGEAIGRRKGESPFFGLCAALVLEAYSNHFPTLGKDPHAVAERVFSRAHPDWFSFRWFIPGDPNQICAMATGIRVMGIESEADFPQVFESHSPLWPHFCPGERFMGWQVSPFPETPANEAWEKLIQRRWIEPRRDPITFHNASSWKRARGRVLSRARHIRNWEESPVVRNLLSAAHKETDAIMRPIERASEKRNKELYGKFLEGQKEAKR